MKVNEIHSGRIQDPRLLGKTSQQSWILDPARMVFIRFHSGEVLDPSLLGQTPQQSFLLDPAQIKPSETD